MDYEQWTRAEIARLKKEAETATIEAATLQRALDKWLEAAAGQVAPTPSKEKQIDTNGVPTQRRRRTGVYGDKNATALEKIKEASPKGLTTQELYEIMAERYGAKYKRSSLRALLWHQKEKGEVAVVDGRYVIAEKDTDSPDQGKTGAVTTPVIVTH